MKNKWYYGKTVVITGASSGFGKLLSEKLILNHGCKVIGIARTQSKLEALKQALGENFTYCAFDVGDKQKWQEFNAYLKEQNIQVDILINNAGVLPPFTRYENYTAEDIERVMQTNFFASVYSITTLLPHIKKSPYSAIINISSSAALCTVSGTGAYSASKSALKSLTESLILENKNTYFSIVCPGFAKTDIFRSQKDLNEKENSLISLVCSDPQKIVNKLLKKMAKKKKRIVLGLDAHLMDFFARLFPRLTPRIIAWVLKRSKVSLFKDVFSE